MARRDVVRARGRTALIVLMVGLPVMLAAGLATVYATNEVSDAESVPGRIGGYQAEVLNDYGVPIQQTPNAAAARLLGTGAPAEPRSVAELERVLGGRLHTLVSHGTVLRTALGKRRVSLTLLALDDAAERPMIQQYAGRLPRSEDEVLVSRTLDRLGYGPGTVVELGQPARRLRVVGVADLASRSGTDQVIGRPGLVVPGATPDRPRHMLQREDPVRWPEVLRLNRIGLHVYSREVVGHPPGGPGTTWDLPEQQRTADQFRSVLTIVVTAIVLEVVLLAGPAFAVGVRRQRRQLALVAATGGTPADVRRCVLAQALLTGVLAAVAGAVLAIPLARIAVWVLPRITLATFGPFEVLWMPTLVAAALGTVAAVIAAWMPARTASRTDVVAVLAGRRGQPRPRRGLPVSGLAAMGAGGAMALVLGRREDGTTWVAAGMLLTVLGAVGVVPLLITGVGRLGRVLPLPLRLAARDSARQRARTAPAVAAVMAAVAGVTALAIGATSEAAQEQRDYVPPQVPGTALVSGLIEQDDWGTVVNAVRRGAPGRPVLPLAWLRPAAGDDPDDTSAGLYVRLPGCPPSPQHVPDERRISPAAARCLAWAGSPAGGPMEPPLVAEPAALLADGYVLTTGQRRVLEHGGVLLPRASLVNDGRVRLVTFTLRADDPRPAGVRQHLVPAAHLPAPAFGAQPQAVLTPATATALGLGWQPVSGVIGPAGDTLSGQEEGGVREALVAAGDPLRLDVERGYRSPVTLMTGALVLAGALAVLIGTFTATGLAMADAQPDLATLAAIGARARTRRVVAAAQAAVIGLLGALTGVVVGFVPGLAVARPLTTTGTSGTPVVDVPWLLLLGLAVAVPLLAAVVAGLTVRSRLPMTRRLDT